jgi:hypothetical protein
VNDRRDRGRATYILICCGAAILVLWRVYAHKHSIWPDFFVQAYLLTGGLFGILLIGDYPPFQSRWFWKSMTPIFFLHAAVIVILLMLTVEIAPIGLQLPTRMVYAFVGVTVLLEWWLCLWLIKMFRSRTD